MENYFVKILFVGLRISDFHLKERRKKRENYGKIFI